MSPLELAIEVDIADLSGPLQQVPVQHHFPASVDVEHSELGPSDYLSENLLPLEPGQAA